MSTAHSVLEMGIHVVAKVTDSAGEHIVDESVENQNERFDLCSDLARREPNDHIHEEYENDSSVDLSGWKRERPPFYKSVLQCSFIVFRIVLLIGSYFGVVENLLVFVILNIMFQDYSLCDLIKEQHLVLTGTTWLLHKRSQRRLLLLQFSSLTTSWSCCCVHCSPGQRLDDPAFSL